jgi:hypothetical protein
MWFSPPGKKQGSLRTVIQQSTVSESFQNLCIPEENNPADYRVRDDEHDHRPVTANSAKTAGICLRSGPQIGESLADKKSAKYRVVGACEAVGTKSADPSAIIRRLPSIGTQEPGKISIPVACILAT